MEKPIGIKYVDAIKEINPNWSGTITGNTESELVIDWNGETEISVADIQAKITEQETAETTAKTTKATNRTNAIAKLKASTWSPLTDDEATALFG